MESKSLGKQIEESVLEVIRKNSRAQSPMLARGNLRWRRRSFLDRYITKGSFIDLAKNCGGRITLRDLSYLKEQNAIRTT